MRDKKAYVVCTETGRVEVCGELGASSEIQTSAVRVGGVATAAMLHPDVEAACLRTDVIPRRVNSGTLASEKHSRAENLGHLRRGNPSWGPSSGAAHVEEAFF